MMATGELKLIKKYMVLRILKGQNIIRLIKKQRLNWLGHVEHMADDNIVQKRDGNPCLKDQLENLKHIVKMTFWKI